MDKQTIYRYNNWDVRITLAKYADNGRIAICLVGADTEHNRIGDDPVYPGEPIATATVNVPDYAMPEGFVAIKDWAENEGMLAFLEENGIVKSTGMPLQCGHAVAHIARVNMDKVEKYETG